MALDKFPKQPNDVQDYDVSYVAWLAALNDTALTHTAEIDPGLTLNSSSLLAGVVKLWTSGGESGKSYKITTLVVTVGGRSKEFEIMIKVKET